MRVGGLADIVVAPNLRFGQIDRVGDYCRVDEMVPVANDKFLHGGLVALRRTVPPEPALLQMRGTDDERVSNELPRRESGKGVRRPCRWMRTSIHPDHSVALRGLRPHVDGN